jgi:NitT/TauT family transport system substrate-binding protein
VVDIVAVNADFLQQHPEMTARLHRAFQRALDYTREHPHDAYTIMGQREGISATEFEQALVGIQVVDAAGQKAFLGPQGSLIHSLADVERTLRRTGQLRGSKPLSALHPGKGN